MSDDIIWTSGWRLAEQIRNGERSSREVPEAFLERAERLEPQLRSFITLSPELALDQADAADQALADGSAPGPLHGVPIAIKDNLWTKDMPTSAGSMLFADYMAPEDGLPAARLRGAGGIIAGKTSMPEFAAWPRTVSLVREENLNPWRLSHTTGASSGGSGTAAAAAQMPLTLGTDGGGSTRLPAALSGVVGVQPSKGIVPAWGQVGYGAFGAVGPMTRDVRDAARMLTVISGPDSRDPMSDGTVHVDYEVDLDAGIDGVTAAWLEGMGDAATNHALNEVVLAALGDLADTGLKVTERTDRFDGLDEHFLPLNVGRHLFDGGPPSPTRQPEVLAAAADPERATELLAPYTLGALAQSPPVTREMWDSSVSWLESTGHRIAEVFAAHDVIICPTAQYTAPPLPADPWSMPYESIGEYIANTGLVNLLRLTAVTVPCGFLDGLPVGLQIIGPRASEALALRIARSLERVRPWAHIRPPIS